MGHLFAQVIIHNDTSLPKDVSVNTFHFDTDATPPLLAIPDANTLIQDFYRTAAGAPGVGTLESYLSSHVRSLLGLEVKYYDMALPAPRQPIGGSTTNLNPGIGASPGEVALVLSFQGALVSGLPQARRRGRIYFGPLDTASVDGDGRPSVNLRDTLVDRGDNMATDSVGTAARWCVFSVTNNDLIPITNGWVDNAFDTQRRRGEDATIRTTWAIP